MHLGGIPSRVTTSHAESPGLTTTFFKIKRKGFLAPDKRGIRTNTLTKHYPPEPTHKI